MKKKSTKIIRSPKSSKRQALTVVSGERAFWVHQGPVLCHLIDLHHLFEAITPVQFTYHTGRVGGNDFASWVKEVLGDAACAAALARAKTPRASALAVKKYLRNYIVSHH